MKAEKPHPALAGDRSLPPGERGDKRRKKGEFTQIVREILQEIRFIRRASDLKLTGGDTWAVLNYMEKSGEVIKKDGGYWYLGRRFRKADIVWRAWRYTPQWTTDEIAQTAGLKRQAVKKLMHIYREYIEKIGRKGKAGIYRLKDRDILERPVIKNNEIQKEKGCG